LVEIGRDFWMGKFEVSQKQWEAVMNSNPSAAADDPDTPVENISWKQIVEEFLIKVNEAEDGSPWRLPSESEWEYSCRAGTTSPHSCSNGSENFYVVSSNPDGFAKNSGTLLPNPWGLYDMHGNVWEWCRDSYHQSYYNAPLNETSWVDSLGVGRIVRGGSFGIPMSDCRSANRDWKNPDDVDKYTGFRLVRSEANDNVAPNTPILIAPADGQNEVYVLPKLVWSCLDPNGDPLRYDLFMGTQSDPPLIASNLTDTTYSPALLDLGANYYWKIEVKDQKGGFVSSRIARFTTHRPVEQEFELGYTGEVITMVFIDPGSYIMGTPDSFTLYDFDERPAHNVALTSRFWIGKYEVSQHQWEAVMLTNPSGFSGSDLPVENVTWEAITDTFLYRINISDSSSTWRLPTEAEWEFACRAETSTQFFWGNDNEFLAIENFSWYNENSANRTHHVGDFTRGIRPNPWGLFDIIGNVSEWCGDWYHQNYFGAPSDGSYWNSPAGTRRIHRGGNWGSLPFDCRASHRGRLFPDESRNTIGFRLVKSEQ
ncbi:formylglycine-generating enzyme family protein, partial [Calditrichota bacterium]